MSRRDAIELEIGVSISCGVGFVTVGSVSIWLSVWGVARVKGLALSTGLPSKATMVMMTLSAIRVETHVD